MSRKNKIIFSAVAILIVGGAIIYYAISNNHQRILINGQYIDSQLVTTFGSIGASNDPEKVAIDFYQYYLTNVYGKNNQIAAPTVRLTGGIYQIDPTQYLKFLNESGFFSSTFYQNELPKFDTCNKALKTITVKQVTDSGGFPTDFVPGDACGFMSFNQWVGGQGEKLDTANVLNSKINSDMAQVTLVIGQKLDETYSYNYSYPTITLVRENGKWKIGGITVAFKKPS
jgi:hypothetical protein